jgi:hypothetical protein
MSSSGGDDLHGVNDIASAIGCSVSPLYRRIRAIPALAAIIARDISGVRHASRREIEEVLSVEFANYRNEESG